MTSSICSTPDLSSVLSQTSKRDENLWGILFGLEEEFAVKILSQAKTKINYHTMSSRDMSSCNYKNFNFNIKRNNKNEIIIKNKTDISIYVDQEELLKEQRAIVKNDHQLIAVGKRNNYLFEFESSASRNSCLKSHLEENYQVESQIELTAHSNLYRINNRNGDVKKLLKIIEQETTRNWNRNIRSHFLTELDVLKRFLHVNILIMSDYYWTSNSLILLFDHPRGGTLEQLLSGREEVNEMTVKNIFRQLVTALGYLHANGRNHFNISPRSIYLTSDVIDDFALVKLTGFEFSCSGDSSIRRAAKFNSVFSSSQTGKKRCFGTKLHDDIWRLGVTLFLSLRACAKCCDKRASEGDDERFSVGSLTVKSLAEGLAEMDENWVGISSRGKHLVRYLLNKTTNKPRNIGEVDRHVWFLDNDPHGFDSSFQ